MGKPFCLPHSLSSVSHSLSRSFLSSPCRRADSTLSRVNWFRTCTPRPSLDMTADYSCFTVVVVSDVDMIARTFDVTQPCLESPLASNQ
ncbi:hypothetical protein F2Q69_00049270 [Brassica cretica]|uniref:Uncharacterized protein n=1 Tax=Brassica cretica TaxID=69181 RepID=A0A8S9PQB7_BRACR|nr:hypothetical protein F2Q69_00049270 [Brassica cretica]